MWVLACVSIVFGFFVVPPPPDERIQYVTVSVDGAGEAGELRAWSAMGERAGARFTYFLSGTYLLAGDRAGLYRPPKAPAGTSDIGFAIARDGRDVREAIGDLVGALNEADASGHEIATHFNGHVCGTRPGAVGAWDARDWLHELDEFDRLVAGVAPNNGIDAALRIPRVVGARSPCFEGRYDALHAALAARDFAYDASVPGLPGPPRREAGLWLFSVPLVDTGAGYATLATDYNFLVNDLGGADLRRSLDAELARRLSGDRAPLSIAFHFEGWKDGAYVGALGAFLADACRRPAVRCVTYRELAQRMDAASR